MIYLFQNIFKLYLAFRSSYWNWYCFSRDIRWSENRIRANFISLSDI